MLPDIGEGTSLTTEQSAVLDHLRYDEDARKLKADRAIETTLNSLYLGEQHKMSSGAENIFFSNQSSNIDFFPMWGGMKDQSDPDNQGASGVISPSGRIYDDMATIQLRGSPVSGTAVPYNSGNTFSNNTAGLGIKTRLAETIDPSVTRLEYRLTVDGLRVYVQELILDEIKVDGEDIQWWFDHPVEIFAGTTITASIHKLGLDDDADNGYLQVQSGNDGSDVYWAELYNRVYRDEDLELISPYLKYQAMDFGLESTGSSILLRDLSLVTDTLLVPYPINTLQAVANGTNIQIKVKDGKKIIVESLPVSACSIDGSFVNSVLNEALSQLNNLFTNTAGFAGTDNPVTAFSLSANTLTITLEDNTSYSVDVTTLGVDQNNFVSSGALSGNNLVLTMNDSSEVTIDVSNMINGSSLSALGQNWFVSYGSSAGTQITTPITVSGHAALMPFYFGEKLTVGSEFVWTQYHLPNSATNYMSIGVWSGAQSAGGAYTAVTNFYTKFGFYADTLTADTSTFANGGYSSKNTDLVGNTNTYNSGAIMRLVYSPDNHLRLYADDVLMATTILEESGGDLDISFVSSDNGIELPSFVKRTPTWNIVHDFDGSEGDILTGIEDHTVIASGVSISPNEKIMFNLNMSGRANFFGTGYSLASSGNTTAEDKLDRLFQYATNEMLNFEFASSSEWNVNTNAVNYFDNGAGLVGYRKQGSGVPQGMFSLRYLSDNTITLFSEDNNEKVATAKVAGDGSPINFYYGVRENTSYAGIPEISKQTIDQSSQPLVDFAPDVSDQTFSITEGQSFNVQIALDTNSDIVNQYVEMDAPSWAVLNQSTGLFMGTAPSYTGSSDDYVINCKAANVIGGTTSFQITLSVSELTYTNTKSLKFTTGNSSYLTANASNVTALQRSANGTGAADAWTIGMWVKTGSDTSVNTLFVYGDTTSNSNARIALQQQGTSALVLTYGSATNFISLTALNSLQANQWQHIVISYAGGATGTTPADLASYFSQFQIYIDGSQAATSTLSNGNGYSGTISAVNMYVGRLDGSSHFADDVIINQLGIWNTDESSNISDLYNAGATQSLNDLTNTPAHYYEIDTSTTTISDINGNAHFTGYNFSVSDLVTDTP